MAIFSAGETEEIEFADSTGTVRTLRARDGHYSTDDAEEAAVLRGAGLNERSESQFEAAKSRRAETTKKTEG